MKNHFKSSKCDKMPKGLLDDFTSKKKSSHSIARFFSFLKILDPPQKMHLKIPHLKLIPNFCKISLPFVKSIGIPFLWTREKMLKTPFVD